MTSGPSEKPGRPKRVTIKDVARAAGVSIGAASAALRDTKSNIGVSRATRERVRRAAQELGYRPNVAARAMAVRAFQSLGVLAAEYCFGSYYSHALRGVVAQAEELGYNVVLKMVPTVYDLETTRIFTEALIDGVIIPAETEEHTREALARFKIPHVWLNAGLDEPFNCVLPDEPLGMHLAVDHLVQLGHRRIAYMPQDDPPGFHTLDTRMRGYVAAVQARGLEPVPTYSQWGEVPEHVDLYLGMRPRPTAIVVCSDAIAAWVINRLLQRGLRVPEDMSVVGNEGVVWHNYAFRRLTTVRAPVHEMGRAAVRMLVEQIRTGQPVPSIKLPVTLEVSESTGPAPADT